MKVNKQNLLNALEIVKPGLANKEIIEQATSFIFIDGFLITYNDELCVNTPVPELKEIEGAIPAENLIKFLAKLKPDEKGDIDLSLSEQKNEILVKAGRSRAGLSIQSEITLPINEDEFTKKRKWKDLPEGFNDAVQKAMGICGRDLTRPALTCVSIDASGIIESSDNYRFVKCDLDQEFPFNSFLLPATSAAEIMKLNPTSLVEGEGWVHFKNEENTIISCRVLSDKYPDTSPLYNVKGIRLILPESTEEVLDRAMLFAKRDHTLDEQINVSIKDRKMLVSAESDSGWFKEDININFKGDPIEFCVTPYLLKSILKETAECILGKGSMMFQGEGWKYVSLLRD